MIFVGDLTGTSHVGIFWLVFVSGEASPKQLCFNYFQGEYPLVNIQKAIEHGDL